MTFRPCAIVPSYNHHNAISGVVDALRSLDIPVLIVDDGSETTTRETIAAFHAPDNGVTVLRLAQNMGKGKAVIAGMNAAHDAGFTHGVQVDADGQHDPAALPELLRLAALHPETLISGKPVYDDTIPTSRKIGRWLTHVWVWVETLSFQITDSMCGYRVYPLKACRSLLQSEAVGHRMDFDTDIMVRLFWRGTAVIMTPVRVTYPDDNTSNFDVLRDNIRITKMHTRLVFTMLVRLPSIIRNRPPRPTRPKHWAKLEERGMSWGLWFLSVVYRLFGYRICSMISQPILLYFFLTGGQQRRASDAFWHLIGPQLSPEVQPGWWQSYRHFRSFGRMALDKVAVWMNDVTLDQLDIVDQPKMDAVIQTGEGVFIIASHLGNIEICRALSRQRSGVKITVLIHSKNAMRFNQLLIKMNPDAAIDMVEVTDLGPATAIELQDRLARGEWIVMAGDRTPVTDSTRISTFDFLGQAADFGQGSVILAGLLKAPVYMMLCLRDGRRHKVIFEKLSDQINLRGGNRSEKINHHLEIYVRFLEKHTKKYPLQWYNFFNFWHGSKKPADTNNRN